MPTIRLANGLDVFYRETGRGNRVLLLIHGNVTSSLSWERVMQALPAGVRAVAPDLRGCGDTAKPDGDWSMLDLAEDAYEFTRALGLGICTVVGHSLGGSIALQLTVSHPEVVEGLVFINSAPAEGLQLSEERYAQVAAMSQMPDMIRLALGAMMPTALKDEYYDRLIAESVAKSAGAWLRNGYALRDMNLVNEARAVRVPALVLYGTKDVLVPHSMAERLRDQIAKATLETMDEVGHSAPVEAPERLARRLMEFLHA